MTVQVHEANVDSNVHEQRRTVSEAGDAALGGSIRRFSVDAGGWRCGYDDSEIQ